MNENLRGQRLWRQTYPGRMATAQSNIPIALSALLAGAGANPRASWFLLRGQNNRLSLANRLFLLDPENLRIRLGGVKLLYKICTEVKDRSLIQRTFVRNFASIERRWFC